MITKEEAAAVIDLIQKSHDVKKMIQLVHVYEKMQVIVEGKDEEVVKKFRVQRKRVDFEEVRKLATDGMSRMDIAKQVGCSPSYVSTVIKKIGMQEQRIDKGKAVALYRAGWTTEDIASDLHCQEEEVEQVIKEAKK